MKKKLLAILMVLVVFCTCFAVQAVAAEEEIEVADDNLRVWFDFSTKCSLGPGREHMLLATNVWEEIYYAGNEVENQISGYFGKGVSVVNGLNGTALKFDGTAASFNEILNVQCASAFYFQSSENLFAGETITINIVYKEDNTEQIQNIFYSGTEPTEFMTIKSSWSTENAGPQVSVNDSGALAEQKISAPADVIPEAGTWNMLTVVQEGTTCKIYLNGTLVQSAIMDYKLEDIASVVDNYHVYALGAPSPYNDITVYGNADVFTNPDYFDDPGFKGLIDDFRIYGSALTEEKIQELAVSLKVVKTEDDENDDSDNGDTGSIVIDWDFSNADSIADVSLGEGVTIENGKAVFAPGNAGIALPDDIFANAETVTIEMTLQPSAFANYTALLCVGNQNGKWTVMGLMEDGSVRYAIATNGDDNSEAKGNSTSGSQGNAHASYQSGAVLSTNKEYAVKYVITQAETNVYIDGELALTVPTPDKDAIGDLGGPVVLGKATKWTSDPSYQGTISSLKITLGTVSADSGEDDENGPEDGTGNEGTGDGTGDEGTGDAAGDTAGDADNEKPVTGDIAMLATLLTAGVAALGGLKLRKKMK